jgi:Serine/threonine protein kinase
MLATAPALLAAVFGWRLYKHFIALLWAVFTAFLLILSVDHVVVFVNSLLVALVSSRALFDRYKNIIITIFVITVIVKIFLFTEYYLDERFAYIYYIADGVFTGLSVFLMYLYAFKPTRLDRLYWLLVPAAVLSSTPSISVSIVAGSVLALVDALPLFVASAAALNAVYLLAAAGDPLGFVATVAFVLAYVLTYKRVLYLSPLAPVGWLYSWLGGRYKVIKLLGVGGFSYVLAVKQRRSVYAAKILRYVDDYGSPLAGDEGILRIFGQEMNRYLEIKSDYVVKAYEVYLPAVGYRDVIQYLKNPPYILLEYMEGGTLRDLLRTARRLPVGQVVELFRQLAQGLYDIHRHNVVHLDIKPENIMFTRDRKTAKIGDMGIAKVVTGGYVRSSYMSPAYAAPEVKRGTATFASDIYSLGCVIYEAATGINPKVFVENGYEIPPPSAYNAEVPPWLDEILLRMLRLDPTERPTAAELVTFLRKTVGGG